METKTKHYKAFQVTGVLTLALGQSCHAPPNTGVTAKANTSMMKENKKSATSSGGLWAETIQKQPITTETIVQMLLAQGLTMDQIVMPGGGKEAITYLADDFDAFTEGFEEYV